MNFIKTSDAESAEELRNLGFQELPKEGKFYVFVNDTSQCHFADNKKLVYTNKLNFGE